MGYAKGTQKPTEKGINDRNWDNLRNKQTKKVCYLNLM